MLEANRGRVLVVEDDDRSRRLMTEVLRDDDYRVVDVDRGEKALKELRRRNASFDVMVLDIQMPGMDGITVAREVRRDGALRELPIIAVTALAHPDDAIRILQAGIDAYLSKPIDIGEVRELVATLVSEGRDPEALAAPDEGATADGTAPGERYEIGELLGEGVRKRVFRARDSLLARDVAYAQIKMEGLDESGRERVMREAQATAQLGAHPNLITIHDMGEEDGQLYVVYEYAGGGSLAALLDRVGSRRFPIGRVVEMAMDICRGLELAHGSRVVHRDLKPSNIFFGGDGTAKIGDFGIALALDGPPDAQEEAPTSLGDASYMSPEQAVGGEVTPRSDLYSFGVVLYELVTGQPPFRADDPQEVISQHLVGPPEAPSRLSDTCPPEMETLILGLLAKSPSDRPASASEVLGVLESIGRVAAAH